MNSGSDSGRSTSVLDFERRVGGLDRIQRRKVGFWGVEDGVRFLDEDDEGLEQEVVGDLQLRVGKWALAPWGEPTIVVTVNNHVVVVEEDHPQELEWRVVQGRGGGGAGIVDHQAHDRGRLRRQRHVDVANLDEKISEYDLKAWDQNLV
ncbi:hypothetical protein TB2_023510 [Malus domestica]